MAPDGERWEEHDAGLEEFKAHIGELVADDLNAAGNSAAETQIIYHYTDVASALAIIETGHFWFTERAHLNDTLELQYGLRIGHEMFEAAVKAAGATVPQGAADHLMGEIKLGLVEFGYWVASFSYEDDDLSQWRSYANEGSGVCLGFSVQDLDMRQFASHIQAVFNFMRFPVRYDEAELRKRMQPYIDLGIQLLRRVNLPSMSSYFQHYGRALLYERDLLQAMMSGMYLHAMMHKHKAYKHEREYRLILNAYRPKVEPSPQHKVRARNGEIVGYLDLPIPNWKISKTLTRIKVGPVAAPKLEEQLATAFRSFGLPLPQLERSKLPFRKTR
jgi:Protein of unknown function (DUF2971)